MDIELQGLIDTHEQPFVVIDGSYRIVAANQRYCEAYGVTPAAIVGQHCHAVSHHSARPCHENGEHCPHQALFERGQAVEVLHTHFHADNQPERTRIRGHRLKGPAGELYLGEQLFPLEADADSECNAMQMVGRSPAFLACVDNLARVAESEASILLFGESGVGKELAARFIHARSNRAGAAFIVINCAAVPETLFESELFGHERGAFSGSSGLKKGLFELADGGTLFLDEVAEIPLNLQAKLLRVLETGEFRRVGGTQTLTADVRLVSATNRRLLDEVDAKRFRLDLYYRLAGIDVTLPPLRERAADLPELAALPVEAPDRRTAGVPARRGSLGRAQGARLSGQCARTAQSAAAGGAELPRRRDPRRRLAAVSRAYPLVRRGHSACRTPAGVTAVAAGVGARAYPDPARHPPGASRPRRRGARHHRTHALSQAQSSPTGLTGLRP